MSNFDVYECIRNEEIREFFRSKGLSVWEQIQVILHSYASIQKKGMVGVSVTAGC